LGVTEEERGSWLQIRYEERERGVGSDPSYLVSPGISDRRGFCVFVLFCFVLFFSRGISTLSLRKVPFKSYLWTYTDMI